VNQTVLIWVFTLGVCLHNAEEAYFAEALSEHADRLRRRIGPTTFRFALLALCVVFLIVATAATIGGPRSVGAYLIAGFALAMVINAVVPHLVATIAARRYAPGTATAVLLNLPLGLFLLLRSLKRGDVDPAVFVYSGPLTALGVLILIAPLVLLARKLTIGWSRP
jgi:ABC-type Fe3+-siderophore transport system permease subunit